MIFRPRPDNTLTWHPYFAWLPVRLLTGEFAWLETVERRFYTSYASWGWEYRQITEE